MKIYLKNLRHLRKRYSYVHGQSIQNYRSSRVNPCLVYIRCEVASEVIECIGNHILLKVFSTAWFIYAKRKLFFLQGLSSLEYRHVNFDLTMCYNIVNKLLDIDAAEIFTVSSNVHSTRGNSYRLQSITIPRHDFRLYFFTSRVVPIWNSLPQHVVSSHNIITFMSRLKTVDLSPFCKLYPFK